MGICARCAESIAMGEAWTFDHEKPSHVSCLVAIARALPLDYSTLLSTAALNLDLAPHFKMCALEGQGPGSGLECRCGGKGPSIEYVVHDRTCWIRRFRELAKVGS